MVSFDIVLGRVLVGHVSYTLRIIVVCNRNVCTFPAKLLNTNAFKCPSRAVGGPADLELETRTVFLHRETVVLVSAYSS